MYTRKQSVKDLFHNFEFYVDMTQFRETLISSMLINKIVMPIFNWILI